MYHSKWHTWYQLIIILKTILWHSTGKIELGCRIFFSSFTQQQHSFISIAFKLHFLVMVLIILIGKMYFKYNRNDTICITFSLFSISKMSLFQTADKDSSRCAFWNYLPDTMNGSWSSEGCELMYSNETHTSCRCNHLTHFAILMSSGSSVVRQLSNSYL